MKVYIIYDRYEHNEFITIYNISKSMKEFKKDYKDEIRSFLEMGPDDCHTFVGQIVNVNDDQLEVLEDYWNSEDPDDSHPGFNLMEEIWSKNSSKNCLFMIDSYDNTKVFEEYMSEQHPDIEEETDEWYELEEEFYDNDTLYETELTKYIDRNYQL